MIRSTGFLLDSAGPDPARTTHARTQGSTQARTHASRSQFGFQDISHICSDLGSDVSTLLPMAGVNRTKRGIRVDHGVEGRKEGGEGEGGERRERKERKKRKGPIIVLAGTPGNFFLSL